MNKLAAPHVSSPRPHVKTIISLQKTCATAVNGSVGSRPVSYSWARYLVLSVKWTSTVVFGGITFDWPCAHYTSIAAAD
jgi:hypothetical protein